MLNPDFRDILSTFSEEAVDYLLVGAYAVAVYGLPRATGDIDLWVRRSPDNAARVWRALARFGAPLSGVTLEEFEEPGVVFQIGVAPRRIDILTSIDGIDFGDAWESRNAVEVDGIQVTVIGREDLVKNKKAVGRPQDLADVALLEGGDAG